jgi:acyl carrier protein
MPDTRDRLIDSFLTVFPDVTPEQVPSASPDTVDSWDSLGTVTLVAVLQEDFGVEFQPDEFMKFTSFAEILALLEQKLSRPTP